MTTYRVVAVKRDTKRAITHLQVREDNGKRLKKKQLWSEAAVRRLMSTKSLFYVFDAKGLRTGQLQTDGEYLRTIGDDDLLDNLDTL